MKNHLHQAYFNHCSNSFRLEKTEAFFISTVCVYLLAPCTVLRTVTYILAAPPNAFARRGHQSPTSWASPRLARTQDLDGSALRIDISHQLSIVVHTM